MGTENFDHELNDLCRALKLPSVARDALRACEKIEWIRTRGMTC